MYPHPRTEKNGTRILTIQILTTNERADERRERGILPFSRLAVLSTSTSIGLSEHPSNPIQSLSLEKKN